MDFNPRKPSHLLALCAVLFSVALTLGLPLISYFMTPLDVQSEYVEMLPESARVIFEVMLVVFQLLFIFALFVAVPVLWYFLVNRFSLRQIVTHLQLKREHFDVALFWGFFGAFFGMAVVVAFGLLFSGLGFDLTDASNVSDLESLFSFPLVFFIVLLQPVAEEVFFRGFLLEKFSSRFGSVEAIIVTSILFGIAHLTYGKVYPAFLAGLLGVVLAYIVVKTKNLYAAITAHIVFNVVNFSIYIIGKSVGVEALML